MCTFPPRSWAADVDADADAEHWHEESQTE